MGIDCGSKDAAHAPAHLGSSAQCRMCRKGKSQGKAKVPIRKLIFAILFFTAEDEERLE